MGPWLWGRGYGTVTMGTWLWGRDYELNETNRKRTKWIFPKCRGKRWKNWIKMKINMQEKHTNINNMRWWGILSIEYLVSSHRNFLNSFNIDVAGMRQRWRDIEPKWYQGRVMAQRKVNHVILNEKRKNFDAIWHISIINFTMKSFYHRHISKNSDSAVWNIIFIYESHKVKWNESRMT